MDQVTVSKRLTFWNGSLTSYGVGNVTDMDGMGAFLSTEEETKWDSDNGCFYKMYTMSEMSG